GASTQNRDVTFVLDPLDQVTERRVKTKDSDSGFFVTQYEYDGLGNLVRETDPSQAHQTWDYDEAGYLSGMNSSMESDLDSPVTYVNDPGGLPTTKTGPFTGEKWTFSYDALGRQTLRTLDAYTAPGSSAPVPKAVWKVEYAGNGASTGQV